MRKFVSQKETAALLCPLGFLLHPGGCEDHDDHDDQVGDDDDDDQDDCDVVDHNDHDIVNAMMLTKALTITST